MKIKRNCQITQNKQTYQNQWSKMILAANTRGIRFILRGNDPRSKLYGCLKRTTIHEFAPTGETKAWRDQNQKVH